MAGPLARTREVLWRAARGYGFDGCSQLAAALAYYAVFSLPAVLVIVFSVGGLFLQGAEVQAEIVQGLGPVGEEAARWAQARLRSATGHGRGVWGLVVGVGAVLVAATSAMGHLQAALNQAWQVAPDPRRGWLWSQLTRRAVGLGVILAGCFLVVLSLSASAVIAYVAAYLRPYLPADFSAPLWGLGAFGASVVLLALLFALVYKLLPDAEVDLRDALTGGLATALLFEVMNALVGTTLGLLDMTTVYGAAGTLALFMLWLNLAASLLLLGAELTQAVASAWGRPIVPREGALRVEMVRRRYDPGGAVHDEVRDDPPEGGTSEG